MINDITIKDTIQNIVNKITISYKPEKIILFGSYVEGNSDINSDIDLLIIKDSNYRRDERDVEIRELLGDIKFPLDIFVYTPQEVEKFYKLKGSFINEIFSKGEILYERQ